MNSIHSFRTPNRVLRMLPRIDKCLIKLSLSEAVIPCCVFMPLLYVLKQVLSAQIRCVSAHAERV
jgi:hypothetical protein